MGEEKGLSHKELLHRALNRVPKSYDSTGKEYYLGPTVGQVISWWFGDNAGAFQKIEEKLRAGSHPSFILKSAQKVFPELTMHHVEWVQGRLDLQEKK